MSDEAIPWYKSAVLRGLLIILSTQALARITARYHIDFAVLGITADSLTQWLLDGLSGVALAYAAHGRTSKPTPPIQPLFSQPKGPSS